MNSAALSEVKATTFFLRVFSAASLLYGIAGLLLVFRGAPEIVEVILVLAISVALPVIVRSNVILFVLGFIIAYANYSAIAANYFAIYSDWYMAFAGTEIAAKGTAVLLIFTSTLLLFLPAKIERLSAVGFFDRFEVTKYSPVFVVIIATLLVVISFTQSSGFSDTGGRASSNQLYEYSYILFIVGFYLCGKSFFCRRLLICVALLFIAQALLGGNRASVLAIVLLIYFLFFAERWPVRRLLPVLIAGFILFQVVGIFRQDIDTASIGEIANGINKLFINGLIWDTAAAAYHQGLVFISYLDIAPKDTITYLTGQWLLGNLLGGSLVADSNLALLVQHHFGTVQAGGLGGGFLPFFGFFYFGVIGILVCGVGVAFVFRLMNSFCGVNDMDAMVRLGLFATVCRWYLYSPSPLIRGVLLLGLVAGVVLLVTRRVSRRPIKRSNGSSPESLTAGRPRFDARGCRR